MKRTLSILLCALMLLSLAACGGKGEEPESTDTPKNTAEPAPETLTESFETGRLYLKIYSEEYGITGLSLSGNRAGNEINLKEPAEHDIRAVFELNEWIEFRLVLGEDQSGVCEVYVVPHRDFYRYKRADLNEISVASVSVDFEGEAEGSFCVPTGCPTGYYDVLFTISGRIPAYTVIRLYPEGELEGKTDAELAAMSEQIKN